MLIDGKEIKTFTLKDLNSKVSFSNWLKTNLSNEMQYSVSQIFESKRYLEYLEYIESQIAKQPLKNKMDWIDRIKKLKKEKEREK